MSKSGTQDEETSDMVYYPFQACRVVDFGDDYFHVTSTVLPLDTQHSPAALDSYAELIEEREIADNWSALCRLVEQSITMYQYVLLAYPEHRRVQQCYNRSILASLFGQNALGSSSSVKTETVSAAPRKLLSRARHLFSSGKSRGSGTPKDTTDTGNLFSSAYSNAVAADSIGPSSGSSPYNHSTISTPMTVLGRYKLKTKGSTMASTRRVNTLQQPQQRTGSPVKSASAASTPSRSSTIPRTLQQQDQSLPPPSLNLGSIKKPPANKRKGSDMSVCGRKPSHTFNELPMFSTNFEHEVADARVRSRTSVGSRNRSSSVSSSKTSPPKHTSQTLSLPSRDSSGALPPSLGNSTSSLVKLDEQSIGRKPKAVSSESEMFAKSRSMSVVSVASISSIQAGFGIGAGRDSASAASRSKSRVERALTNSTSASAGSSSSITQGRSLLREREDNDSEFSIQLDLHPHDEGLDIPSDLKLEFDEALSGAGTTPPTSTYDLSVDTRQFATSHSESVSAAATGVSTHSAGLNLMIPSASQFQDTKHTWDAKSPEDHASEQQSQLPFGSNESINSRNSARTVGSKGAASRSLSRRRGVYGAPLQSPASGSVTSPPLMSTGEQSSYTARQKPDILLDIARELGDDEHFMQRPLTSPFYVDDDDMALHLDQMSVHQDMHA
ncbi:hypothetical protein H4R20_005900, partial [Coemansia guatemalensis]